MVEVELYAKPIVDGKFWIVEQDGLKVATLHKKDNNKYVLSNTDGELLFDKEEELTTQFGENFFLSKHNVKISASIQNECYGFPTSCVPYNSIYDVRRKLPLFTKSDQSKSLYCAGYYIIKFEKGWVKSFCPKVITIERNEHKGPFKSEIEMKMVLANAKND